jgi:MFS transporter, DHA3 family, multidrug efflux protein
MSTTNQNLNDAHMKVFHQAIANNTIAGVSNMFVWFCLTFYVYLGTKSVIATSILAGVWALGSVLSSVVFGTYVDHHRKKSAMLLSSILTFGLLALAGVVYILGGGEGFLDVTNPVLWLFSTLCLLSSVAGNMRGIAVSTLVSLLVPEKQHDKANGLVGMTMGIVFSFTSILSGLGIGFLGMGWAIIVALVVTALTMIHLQTLDIAEKKIEHLEKTKKVDFKGAFETIRTVPGLTGLLVFATFNNLIGGVFMSLMDAYGLSLVDVKVWGVLWAVLSLGFIIGGVFVSKKGTGKNPVATIFRVNMLLWFITIFFTAKYSIWPMAIGMMFYMTLMPIIEAAEQTTIQKVVPLAKQGRVFGFNQTVEQAASPVTAFLIGPIAQGWAIPFMSEGGRGARAIGSWFGVGQPRGIALIFSLAGMTGLVMTFVAYRSKAARNLSKAYSA